jgi:ATP-dependent DNA helicase DinG
MIAAVSSAFNDSRLALIEAGTGTGKSLAYLLPAIFWAHQSRQRVAISTNTINLQEQLVYKDLPFLQTVLGFDFKAVLVKGRNNYVCLNKLDALQKEGAYLIETDEQAELQAIMAWAAKTQDGSKADLGLLPRPAVWEKAACESDNCGRIKCPFYSRCFFYKARREAASADLLVANHHLLFSDLALRGATGQYRDTAILPAYTRIILDEAHNVEEVATDYFGAQVSKWGFLHLLGRFYSLREREKVRERGLLPYLLTKLQPQESKIALAAYTRIFDHVESILIPQRENLSFLAEQVFDGLAAYFETLAPKERQELKVRFTPGLRGRPDWAGAVLAPVGQLIREAGDFHQQLLTLDKWLAELPEESQEALTSQMVELGALIDRLEVTATTLGSIFAAEEDGLVRWVEAHPSKRGKSVLLKQAPLEVAALLGERVFDKFKTVVMTSATLTTEGRFDYMKQRLGLDRVASGRLLELQLPSSFNYQRQALLGIPNNLPSPDEAGFGEALSRAVLQSVLASQGRALVLFTSYSLLRKVHQELAETLQSSGIRPLKQGEAPRHRLTQIFRDDKTSVLFATDSFWEGVDVAGEALENVILTKLPFSVPKEPIIQARVEAIEKRGGNPFMEYSVPQAVIKLKQGFGRLIRTRTDRGTILIFDRRILEKFYGKIFLRSLPECRLVVGSEQEVVAAVKDFFNESRATTKSKG